MKNNILYTLAPIIVIILMGIVILFMNNKMKNNNTRINDYKNLVNNLDDTLKSFRTKDSSQVSTISILQVQKAKDFLSIKTKNEEVLKLQDLVKEYKVKQGSVAVIASNTNVTSTNKTTVREKDTIIKDSFVYIYPEYSDSLNLGKWVNATIVMNKDSSRLSLGILNEYDLIFKKGEATIINHNPYSINKSVKVFQTSNPPPKRFGIGLSGGYGLVLRDNIIYLTPYIGISFNYNLIRF